MKIVPVIMAGGAGTRLWPLSRDEKPKQFHNLSGKGTLLEETIKRLLPLKPDEYVIVTSHRYADMSKVDAAKAGAAATILAEPQPKNTSAAVLYAAVYLDKKYDDDSVMIALPADHHIQDYDAFTETLKLGVREAEKGGLVTIGIRPSYPETGYGYIKAADGENGSAMRVERFVEKPDISSAKKYLTEGTYYWNAGIFLWKTSTILEAFKKYLPDMFAAFEELHSLSADNIKSRSADIAQQKSALFQKIESISIDYGILEKAENRIVIPAGFGWVDLGSWKSIDSILTPDSSGNRTPDPNNAVFVDAKNCSVFSEDMHISIAGLDNVVAVQAGKNVLIINKEASQEVKQVVEIIKSAKGG
ncbi:MAG: NTP transferase domain-containing protein [Spirochaetia bacterium]|jgi:mannose-1-phosphate guanylyltransferase|nr:NTP transferase domain-containing protein [Spirochaetia bacterium]